MNLYARDVHVGPLTPDVNVIEIDSDDSWCRIHVRLQGHTAARLATERMEKVTGASSVEWLGGDEWALGYYPDALVFP